MYSLFSSQSIDGINITSIGLLDLRSRLTYIPQEAVLFSGTVRTNLDPFEQHSDSECLDALERVHMVDNKANGMRGLILPNEIGIDSGRMGVTLESKVSQGGHNFSAGQRQLLAMARALLRRSRIIIMDEATASVDFDTDAKVRFKLKRESVQMLMDSFTDSTGDSSRIC